MNDAFPAGWLGVLSLGMNERRVSSRANCGGEVCLTPLKAIRLLNYLER